MKSKLLYSINHCKAIDADFNRAGVGGPNEEENAQEGAEDNAAAAAESEESEEERNVNLFGDDHVSENIYGEEEE